MKKEKEGMAKIRKRSKEKKRKEMIEENIERKLIYSAIHNF
jgi:hypothetical protein